MKGPRPVPSELVNVILPELDGEFETDPNAPGRKPDWSWDEPEKATWKQ